MRYILLLLLFGSFLFRSAAQVLPGFSHAGNSGEQQLYIENPEYGTRILVNAPVNGFGKRDKVLLIFYALPNGSTIEHTIGKKMKPDDDYRFDLQHIGAQTRFLRNVLKNRTVVVASRKFHEKLALMGSPHPGFIQAEGRG